MKDHVEIDHLTKYDGTETKLWTLTWKSLKIHSNVSNFETAIPKPYKLISFVTTVKSRHAPTI